MAALVLYHANPSRSAMIRWMLEEVGEPYEVRPISLKAGDNQTPEFLALNPMGKVPVLVHNGVAIAEGAAIATYLADAFPAANLAVPVGDPRRGPYLQWLFFGPSCLEPAILERAYPRKEAAPRSAAGFGNADLVIDVLTKATAAANPYLLGAQFTAADVIIGSGVRWAVTFKLIPDNPAFSAYVARLNARPAYQRAVALDEAAPR